MVVVEVFCGSGRLTASLKQEGFDAFGIDHVVLKHAACSVLKLDLLCRESAAHLWRIVADSAVQFIHFAPPCGTASRKLLGPNCVAGTSYVVLKCGSVLVPCRPARRSLGLTLAAA